MKQIKDTLFSECLAQIPEVERMELELYQDIAERVDNILHEKHLTQRDLARLTGKRESEVSKWLTGRHNFTMKTIALISSALRQPILSVC